MPDPFQMKACSWPFATGLKPMTWPMALTPIASEPCVENAPSAVNGVNPAASLARQTLRNLLD